MDDIWLHNLKLVEVLSESYAQMALNLWVIKTYGMSDPIQLLSFLLAYFGLIKIHADRYCFIRNGEDFGMASWSYINSFLDLIIPYLTGFIRCLIGLSEDCIPAWLLLGVSLQIHPILSWIVSTFRKKHISNTNISSRHFTVRAYTLMIISIFVW